MRPDNAVEGVRITRQTGLVQTVTVSPDETEVAVLSDNGGHANVWVAGVAERGNAARSPANSIRASSWRFPSGRRAAIGSIFCRVAAPARRT